MNFQVHITTLTQRKGKNCVTCEINIENETIVKLWDDKYIQNNFGYRELILIKTKVMTDMKASPNLG